MGDHNSISIDDLPTGRGPGKVIGAEDLASETGSEAVGYDDTLATPPLGANTLQGAIDALKSSPFIDYSVNGARGYLNQDRHLILESNIRTNVAGNFNGGGIGNKPIVGLNLPSLRGLPLAQLPRLQAAVALRTSAVAPKGQRGLSYNVFVDLNGLGNPADVIVLSITATLNSALDNGLVGLGASVTDFDITDYQDGLPPGTGRSYNSGPLNLAFPMTNAFYVVYSVPLSALIASWYTGGPGYPAVFTSNPVNLDMILSGGVMPGTGSIFAAKPNARLIGIAPLAEYASTDGGMPAGTPIGPVTLQIGDSSLNLRCVTDVTSLVVGGTTIL